MITLAPAAIALMGEAAWWLPRWLDRILPHVSIEGEEAPAPAAAEPELEAAAVTAPQAPSPGQHRQP